jgi:hypothetical protein
VGNSATAFGILDFNLTPHTIEDGIDEAMAIILGKRKRVHRVDLQERSSSPESSQNSGREDLQAIFKRHFEAKFKPLDPEPEKTKMVEQIEDVLDEDEDSGWEGINSSEEAAVEVIEHSASRVVNERARKDELRAFMVKFQAMCASMLLNIYNSPLNFLPQAPRLPQRLPNRNPPT